jgi:hypothetical protein
LARYSKLYSDIQIKIPTKTAFGKNTEIELREVISLLCYPEPEQSDFRYLVNDG